MQEKQPIIEIKHLTKVYRGSDVPAIDNISLDIQPGEIYGLLGPNGAGKTTTISILCGLFDPTAGNIFIDGMEYNHSSEKIKSIIGVVPQDIALYPSLTAKENLTFFGHLYGLKGKNLRNRIDECLELFGLEKTANRKIKTYSGGMKRRINLIAGILHKPKIIFLDEPTVGVDVQSRNVILNHLRDINKEGTTLIYTSHYMEEAENFCTRVAIIDQGKIITEGKPKDLVNSKEEYTDLESIFLHLTGKALRDE
ncbi:MAG: ABC transporter ATP-binding protein [Bacteroidetes bacterium GWF2_33_16]|nr:MAG: ABC transporter ATP-binding protein [Bacteroidetes bacterium GWE2_32_14]OFY03763.1 MAG: ABC transporter ATP-binding protein [Bacteroidetes bacterium GWF2_33_16]